MSTTPMPDYPSNAGEETQDQSNYQECQDDIKALQGWAQQVGAKIGIPFTPDTESPEEDALGSSLAATKPFGMGSGMSNS